MNYKCKSGVMVFFSYSRAMASLAVYLVIRDFLNNRQQRIVLNGKSPDWSSVMAGVP